LLGIEEEDIQMVKSFLFLAILSMSAPAFAADEFGQRFGGHSPAALGEPVAGPAAQQMAKTPDFDPALIEPAAGDEEPAAQNSQDIKPQNSKPQVSVKHKPLPENMFGPPAN
jgi:hypothetical protein